MMRVIKLIILCLLLSGCQQYSYYEPGKYCGMVNQFEEYCYTVIETRKTTSGWPTYADVKYLDHQKKKIVIKDSRIVPFYHGGDFRMIK